GTMKTRPVLFNLFSIVLLSVTAVLAQSQIAPTGQGGPIAIRSTVHSVSPPLRNIRPIAPASTSRRVIPLHRPPVPRIPRLAPGTDWTLQSQSSSQSLTGNANFGP